MKILAIERPGPSASPERMRVLLKTEANRLWTLYQNDIVREYYFTLQHDAVLVLECADERQASEYLESLPLVHEGQIRFEVMGLTPYTGFERLFDNKEEQ
jgi:hypothetical protein